MIPGVRLLPLTPHRDPRGVLVEVFREAWDVGVRPVQWAILSSEPGTLRGCHVHPRHDDYLILFEGRTSVGLKDLRESSPSFGLAKLVEIDGRTPIALTIPHGVAHGFLHHERSVAMLGASAYFDPADELACSWDDPELGIEWGASEPVITSGSPGSYRSMLSALEPFQRTFAR
jgi:dTDP-4-dehydrorhamnose 3,5-epimerase